MSTKSAVSWDLAGEDAFIESVLVAGRVDFSWSFLVMSIFGVGNQAVLFNLFCCSRSFSVLMDIFYAINKF